MIRTNTQRCVSCDFATLRSSVVRRSGRARRDSPYPFSLPRQDARQLGRNRIEPGWFWAGLLTSSSMMVIVCCAPMAVGQAVSAEQRLPSNREIRWNHSVAGDTAAIRKPALLSTGPAKVRSCKYSPAMDSDDMDKSRKLRRREVMT